MLSVQGLTCRYAERVAVQDLSFSVTAGEVLGFLGPNGAGKSTTMDAICGIRRPSAGRIALDGVDLARAGARARAALGYLPEHPPIYSELTVEEYLRFCAGLRGLRGAGARSAVAEALESCELLDVRGRLTRNLSRGFQQRLGIAQAIVHRPKLVILDEPTVGLDPNQIRNIRDLIRGLGRDRAVLLSTHILAEVQEICDRVVILHRGQLVYEDRVSARSSRSESRMRLVCERPPALGTLRALPGVADAHLERRGVFRLTLSEPSEALRELLSRAVAERWELRELAPDAPTLEETFVALTCADPSAAPPTAPLGARPRELPRSAEG